MSASQSAGISSVLEVPGTVRSVAVKMFLEKGFKEASLRDISEAAQVPYGSIHRLTGGKDSLLFYLLVEPELKLCERLNLKLIRGLSAKEALCHYIDVYIKVAISFRRNRLLGLREGHSLSAAQQEELKGYRDHQVKTLWEIVAVGTARQVFKAADLRFAAKVVLSTLEGVINNRTLSDEVLVESIPELQRMALGFFTC